MSIYRSSINTLIAKQFPLKSTEFPVGSPQYNEYISVIEKVFYNSHNYTSPLMIMTMIGQDYT